MNEVRIPVGSKYFLHFLIRNVFVVPWSFLLNLRGSEIKTNLSSRDQMGYMCNFIYNAIPTFLSLLLLTCVNFPLSSAWYKNFQNMP
jgi:hypothetical protein